MPTKKELFHRKLIAEVRAGRRKPAIPKEDWDKPLFVPEESADQLLARIAARYKKPDGFLSLEDLGFRSPPEDEESRILCAPEYHFARFVGPGAQLAPLLYSIFARIGYKSGRAFAPIKELKPYLNVKNDHALYDAAALLYRTGWLDEVQKRKLGEPVVYRARTHEEWAQITHGLYCTKKREFPIPIEDTALRAFGRQLYGITGATFFDNILKGYLKLGTEEEILARAKEFMRQEGNTLRRAGFRKRLGQFLRDHQEKK